MEGRDEVEPSEQFKLDMKRMQLEMQSGGQPSLDLIKRVAKDMDRQHRGWEALVERQRDCQDFQLRERFEWTNALLARRGQSLERLGRWMRHEIDTLLAYGEGRPPPPDPGLGMEPEPAGGRPQGLGDPQALFTSGRLIEISSVFDQEVFESPLVREEYDELYRDHGNLIKLGEFYGGFDAAGKLAFLDQVEKAEQRWDVFFGRFALLDALKEEYKEQCETLLRSRGCNVREFRELLSAAHDRMRDQANQERMALPR